jgi:hypothetical protein
MRMTGTLIGYDPGGNGSHGLALIEFVESKPVAVEIDTYSNANQVINRISAISNVLGIGVDTLTYWSTGDSGWRPADRWLKGQYKSITNSIASANSLFGSMGLNGMAVLDFIRTHDPKVAVTETHPKVLYYELAGVKYDYRGNSLEMDLLVSNQLDIDICTKNDHEWDAAVSVYALLNGITGKWTVDLHRLPLNQDERLVQPCGNTNYWWPNTAKPLVL